jgi:histidine triad (HIT) family protein
VPEDDAFCKMVRGESKAYVVYRDDKVMVILDRSPICRGHMLVISKEHFAAVEDVRPDVVSRAFLVAAAIAKYLKRELKAPGVNIVTNSGGQAGQVVFHFHVHIIPRWAECPPPIFSDEGVNITRVAQRHRLTEAEAAEVLNMMSGVASYIEEYVRGGQGPSR